MNKKYLEMLAKKHGKVDSKPSLIKSIKAVMSNAGIEEEVIELIISEAVEAYKAETSYQQ